MSPINSPVTSARPLSGSNPHTINLERRLEENRPFVDSLKEDPLFQNVLTLMRRFAVPETLLFRFVTGKAHLELCSQVCIVVLT